VHQERDFEIKTQLKKLQNYPVIMNPKTALA